MFKSFSAVTYDDMALEERCHKCWCCTNCKDRCGCAGEEDEDETAVRVLGLRPSEQMKLAEEWKNKFVKEEEKVFGEGREEASAFEDEDNNVQLDEEWVSDSSQ